MPASVKVVDEKFHVVWANAVALEESGYDLPTLRGRVCCQYLQGLRENCPWCPVIRALRDGQEHVHTVERNGRQMEITGYVLPVGKDGVRYAVEITRDVTPLVSGETLKGSDHFSGVVPPDAAVSPQGAALGDRLGSEEKRILEATLRRTRGDMGAAAREAGFSVKTLQRRMRKYGLDYRAFRHPTQWGQA